MLTILVLIILAPVAVYLFGFTVLGVLFLITLFNPDAFDPKKDGCNCKDF